MWTIFFTKPLMMVISPWMKSARKISRFLMRMETLLSSTRSRPISPVQRCQTSLVVPSIESKVRALLTGVEICDFIDSEGNIVSVDADFSRAAEVQELVRQSLKIEMQKIEDTDYRLKENVARVFINRIVRGEREGE